MNSARRLDKFPSMAVRLGRHPLWSVEHFRSALYWRSEQRRNFALDDHRDYLVDLPTAVCMALRSPESRFHDVDQCCWSPPPGTNAESSILDARPPLQRLLSAVVRLVRPLVVVETGVARGVSTAVVLKAMADNDLGHLHSIDLPALAIEARGEIGSAIPAEVKPRWTLHLGPSRRLLPRVAASTSPIDVFVHDADHTYPAQLHEYETIWPHLRPGGCIVSDDIRNDAFVDFAFRHRTRPYLIAESPETAIGILRKPEADG